MDSLPSISKRVFAGLYSTPNSDSELILPSPLDKEPASELLSDPRVCTSASKSTCVSFSSRD